MGKWTVDLERYIERLGGQCRQSFEFHKKSHPKLDFRTKILDSIALLLPLRAASLNELPFVTEQYRFVPSILMVLSGGVVSL